MTDSMLRIYNTLSGELEEFIPLSDPVRMYVCGMTPKFHPHVGHARLFVAIDAIRRILEHRGYRVHHVQNFTDIDDKIIARAESEGATADDVARRYTDSYFDSMAKLSVLPAHEYPSVTSTIPQIIGYVATLIERGVAYEAKEDVYFQVDRFPSYGKLSGRSDEGGMVGVRVELEPGKRDPRDFALWKRAKPGEPSWPSPWGRGRPGWHIECSTMVRETLGDQIDIHCGGQDLIFPHHENEIAQSESFTGIEPFARYWAHIGLVMTGSEKMAHSLMNFTTVNDVLGRYEPAALRLHLLGTHYRSPMVFSEDGIAGAARSLRTLRAAYGDSDQAIEARSGSAAVLLDRFESFLDDDFNTAGAIGVLFESAHEVNRAGKGLEEAAQRVAFQKMADVLGMDLRKPASEPAALAAAPFVDLLLDVRAALRAERNFGLADRLRDGLKELGIVLEDGPAGTTWRMQKPGEDRPS